MRKIEIKYDPYKMNTTVIDNGINVLDDDFKSSTFKELLKSRTPLQTWIEPIPYSIWGDWPGLINALVPEDNNDDIEIEFTGRDIDFDDLKKSCETHNNKRVHPVNFVSWSHKKIASWHKSQEALEKRFNSTAEYYQNKASKEWARFVNADENGYFDSEKWNHFRNSQYCYEKKHEFEQKAAHIRERIDVINESIKKYSDDLSNKSEFSSTIKTPPFELSDIKMRTPEENAKMREEFDDYKADLKREWEKANGTSWPKYKEDVISQSGKVIRKEGSDYDAHHIQPLSMGGKNEVSNITPLHADVHYDKQGIHMPAASASPFELESNREKLQKIRENFSEKNEEGSDNGEDSENINDNEDTSEPKEDNKSEKLSEKEINEKQKADIKETLERIRGGEKLTNEELGNLGEMMMDQYYISKDYKPLNKHRVTSLDDKKDGFKTGIDGVYEKTNPDGTKNYVIADAKYNTAQLSETNDGKQMSDNWIDKRLDDAVGKEKADEIRDAAEDDPDSVIHEVYHVDPNVDENENIHTDTQEVDSEGNKVGDKMIVEYFDKYGNRIDFSPKE